MFAERSSLAFAMNEISLFDPSFFCISTIRLPVCTHHRISHIAFIIYSYFSFYSTIFVSDMSPGSRASQPGSHSPSLTARRRPRRAARRRIGRSWPANRPLCRYGLRKVSSVRLIWLGCHWCWCVCLFVFASVWCGYMSDGIFSAF